MALLGASIDPSLFRQDYSGFVNAANTNANAIAGLGQTIANTATDYFKDQNEKKKLLKQSSTQIDAAIKLYPELQGAFTPILDNLRDENISLNDRFASASATPGLIELAIGQSNKNRDFGLKERELGIQEERYTQQAEQERNRYIESQKPDASKWTNYNEVINIGGRPIKVVGQIDQYGVFKDLNGNQYPNVGMAFSDTQPTTEQNNGMVLPDRNVPTPPSTIDFNAVPSVPGDVSVPQPVVSPDTVNPNVASNEIIMPAGSSYVTQEKFRPFNAEESKLYGSQGQVDISTNRAYPITPPSGTSFKTNPDGSVEYITGAGVSQKTENAAKAGEQLKNESFRLNQANTEEAFTRLDTAGTNNPVFAAGNALLAEALPASETGELAGFYERINGENSFIKMKQQRDSSVTGGASGTMTEKEWPRYEGRFSPLKINARKDTIAKSLSLNLLNSFEAVNGTPDDVIKLLNEKKIDQATYDNYVSDYITNRQIARVNANGVEGKSYEWTKLNKNLLSKSTIYEAPAASSGGIGLDQSARDTLQEFLPKSK